MSQAIKWAAILWVAVAGGASAGDAGSHIVPATTVLRYEDGRPSARYRLDAEDVGPVLLHGEGPNLCDIYGARDVWAFKVGGTVYLHYDAAGPAGWLAALATTTDLKHFVRKGAILELGNASQADSASASYGTTYFDGRIWRMFYLATRNATPPPGRIPALPYVTLAARSRAPEGPWVKETGLIPFTVRAGTYYGVTASPGFIVKQGDTYLQFFSAAMPRTIGIARTKNLDGRWTLDPEPILPREEQIENSSIYFQESSRTWFLFTDHVGVRNGFEFTDAIWVYWSQDLEHWDPNHRAIVLDNTNQHWSPGIVGLPSVVPVGGRLAIFYDGRRPTREHPDPIGHLYRDVGLAWLDLPIHLPDR
ncbi:MAG TPA: hypothetical protein VID77_07895 [Stellaceae bacterium]